MIMIESKYTKSFENLVSLYGEEHVNRILDRLNYIHTYTENIWEEYVEKIPDRSFKYLLIAEAPPWKEKGKPEYVLDPSSNPRSLMSAICKAFYREPIYKSKGRSKVLSMLANDGFLVIDSIPFSMDYSNPNKRKRQAYMNLVKSSLEEYMLPKLSAYNLKLHPDLKIAFSLKTNARQIIDILSSQLVLDEQTFTISESNIGVNGAGYPDSKKIEQIYFS